MFTRAFVEAATSVSITLVIMLMVGWGVALVVLCEVIGGRRK